MFNKKRYIGAPVAALLLASASTAALAVDQAIIVGEAGFATAATGLEARLVAAGYNVTITHDSSTLTGNLNGIAQVWDVRGIAPLSGTDASNYLSYLNNAGGLFLLGENASFATRNNSVVSFLVTAGGGSVTYGGATVVSQYVTDIFNGSSLIAANSSTSFYVPASGTFSNPGNGTYITTTGPNGTGDGTGIAFGAGSLTNAPTGRLLTYLDVNTFQAQFYDATPALRSLIDRMIGFVAGSFQVDPNLPPVGGGATIIDASQPSFNLSDPAATGNTITFDGGTLDISGGSDPANLVTSDVIISENGAFINTAGTSSTFSGEVSGDGGLIVSGQGTIALTGTNSYVGGTLISDSSTVQINSGGALGTGGVVLMGGQLETLNSTILTAPITLMSGLNAIDTGAHSVTANGTITGTGGFVKTGSGTLTLTAPNSYSGGTIIADGTLAGSASSIIGDVVNGGSLIMNQPADDIFNGVISGNGSFLKSGPGRLNLTGSSTYSGNTIVDDGRLAVNGSIANSIVIVQDGGSIGGNGLVGGLIVRTNATAAPGNSIGQLQAATTVLFEPDSSYQVEVDATGASDHIVATGVATLQGGTVEVLAAAGDYRPQTSYEILTASEVDGEFADVTSNLAFLIPTLGYSQNAVMLTLTRNDIRFADIALTANQRATAGAIDASVTPTGDLYNALVGQSAQGARSAINLLSGEMHASSLSIAAQHVEDIRRSLLDRLSAPGTERPTLWTELVGSWNNLDATRNTAAVSSDARGFRVGLEGQLGVARVGVAGGYTDSDLRIHDRDSNADLGSIHGAVYAGAKFGSFAFRVGGSYTDLDFETRRTAAVGTLSQALAAKYGGHAIQVFGEAGYSLPLGIGSVEPVVGVNALWLKNRAFTEQGGNLALQGDAQTRDHAWSTVGLKVSVPMGINSPAQISVKGGWQHALTKRTLNSNLAFATGGPSFSIEGASLAKDAALVDAGVNWAVTNTIRLGIGYAGTIADQSDTHTAKAVLAVNF